MVTIINGFDEICILIMIHKLDSKLISKPKKIVIIIVVVVKYLAFIFGNHFAYSSIKIGLKKKKNLHYFQHFQLQLQYFQPKNNQLAFRLFCYNIFSNKFSVSVKINGFQIDTKYVTLIYQENNR